MNYRRGVRKERACMKILSDAGYICMRTAGSHGPFDVVAIGPGVVRMIQVKRTKDGLSPGELEVIRDELRTLPMIPCLSYELWVWIDELRKWHFERIR